MGWAPGDQEKVERAKVELAFVKDGIYKLNRLETTICNIQHKEKRDAMLVEIGKIHEAMRALEMHLTR